MSTLLLDDVGLCLLRQLNESWEAAAEYTVTAPNHDYIVTSMNDLWRLDAEYQSIVQAYIDHLVFIYANRLYWPRLTNTLWADINISLAVGEMLASGRDISHVNYIGNKSVQAYRRYIA